MGHYEGDVFQGIMHYLPQFASDGIGNGVTFGMLVGDWADNLLSFLVAWFIARWIFKICVDVSMKGGKR